MLKILEDAEWSWTVDQLKRKFIKTRVYLQYEEFWTDLNLLQPQLLWFRKQRIMGNTQRSVVF